MNNGLNPDIIIKDDPYWKEKLADYCYSKEVIDIPKEYYPQKITNKMVINNNNIFNTITQNVYCRKRFHLTILIVIQK